jgi:hypothetical protein
MRPPQVVFGIVQEVNIQALKLPTRKRPAQLIFEKLRMNAMLQFRGVLDPFGERTSLLPALLAQRIIAALQINCISPSAVYLWLFFRVFSPATPDDPNHNPMIITSVHPEMDGHSLNSWNQRMTQEQHVQRQSNRFLPCVFRQDMQLICTRCISDGLVPITCAGLTIRLRTTGGNLR